MLNTNVTISLNTTLLPIMTKILNTIPYYEKTQYYKLLLIRRTLFRTTLLLKDSIRYIITKRLNTKNLITKRLNTIPYYEELYYEKTK